MSFSNEISHYLVNNDSIPDLYHLKMADIDILENNQTVSIVGPPMYNTVLKVSNFSDFRKDVNGNAVCKDGKPWYKSSGGFMTYIVAKIKHKSRVGYEGEGTCDIKYYLDGDRPYVKLKDGSKGYISISEDGPQPDEVNIRINLLRSMYQKLHMFPDWVAEAVSKDIPGLMKPVRVYYPHDCPTSTAELLFSQREPTNFFGKSYFHTDKLKKTFGWRRGGYSDMSVGPSLPPNIGVYTPALVDITGEGKPTTKIHIFNSIGIAMDSSDQSDYNAIMILPETQRTTTLVDIYFGIFIKIFQCAHDLKLSTIIMSLVGVNLAIRYPGSNGDIAYEDEDEESIDAFQIEVWVPSFIAAYRFCVKKNNSEPSILFMGADGSTALKKMAQDGLVFEDIGRFPENVNDVDIDVSLFVNAWDPLSVPGNGNNKDDNLNGFVGRCTSIAGNGTGITNPYANFHPMMATHI